MSEAAEWKPGPDATYRRPKPSKRPVVGGSVKLTCSPPVYGTVLSVRAPSEIARVDCGRHGVLNCGWGELVAVPGIPAPEEWDR